MRKLGLMLAVAAMVPIAPAIAQDDGLGEVVVTASRAQTRYYEEEQTVIGLRRTADSAVQYVKIGSDSRDEATRKSEIRTMLASAIQRAGAAGVQLVTGDVELVPLTQASVSDLLMRNGNRPDTSEIGFMVKAKIDGSAGKAQDRIDAFVKSVPANGRALMEKTGGTTLTIINPDQYRDQVIKMVAAESTRYAAMFGPDYGVSINGLDQQLVWTQVSPSEVFLYLPYRFSVQTK